MWNNLITQRLLPIIIISSAGIISYLIKRNTKYLSNKQVQEVQTNSTLKTLVILSNGLFFDEVLRYIYIKYPNKIQKFNYSSEKIYHFG